MKQAGSNQLYRVLALLGLALGSAQLYADDPATEDRIDVLDPLIEKLQWGPFKLGGWMRWDYRWKDYGSEDDAPGEIHSNGVALKPSYRGDRWSADAAYRFYRYEGDDDWYTFLQYGYLTYHHDDETELYLGVHLVPFGNLSFTSFNLFSSLGWILGVEDDNDLGIKYIKQRAAWNLQLAYYLTDEGHYTGRSSDSARYSADPVNEGPIKNEERHQGNVRLVHQWKPQHDVTVEKGVSVQYGGIHNGTTGDTGDLLAYALHLDTHCQRWDLKLQATRYEYDLRNPPGQPDNVVQMGSFDAAYFIAAKATLYTASLAYTLPLDQWHIDSIQFHANYSYLDKDDRDFTRSQFVVPGLIINTGRFIIYADLMYGMNYPYVGPDTFSTGAAAGSGNSDWHTFFNLSVGYYF